MGQSSLMGVDQKTGLFDQERERPSMMSRISNSQLKQFLKLNELDLQEYRNPRLFTSTSTAKTPNPPPVVDQGVVAFATQKAELERKRDELKQAQRDMLTGFIPQRLLTAA